MVVTSSARPGRAARRHDHVGAGRTPSRRGADPAQRLRCLDPGLLRLIGLLRLVRLYGLRGPVAYRLGRLGAGGAPGGDKRVRTIDQPPRARRRGLKVLRLIRPVKLYGLRGPVAYRLGRLGAGGAPGGDKRVRTIDQPSWTRRRGLVGVRATAGATLRRRLIGHWGGERRKLPRRRTPGGIPCRTFLGRRDLRGRRQVFLIA
ncbi:hypothetical protein ACQP25_40840 [Microtetraspora malaysiensis]|uniref:hypothetical protein n=1 Tax=Microtetraspora malaysiensis TaxID=161358 RepID=UPI003D8CFDE0